MARRGKSINDINNQLLRIGTLGGAGNGSRFYETSRGRRVSEIANRYERNIKNVPGIRFMRNGIPFVNNTKKVSRSTYMGIKAKGTVVG